MRILSQAEQFAYRVGAALTKLYRGLNLSPFDLTPEHQQRLRAVLTGALDPVLGQELLAHVTKRYGNTLGIHWTTHPGAAHYFANGHYEGEDDYGLDRYVKDDRNIPLVIEAEWSGDPNHLAWQPGDIQGQEDWTGAGDERYSYEHEATLKPGVPLRVIGLHWARDWGQGTPKKGVGTGYKNLLHEPYEGTT